MQIHIQIHMQTRRHIQIHMQIQMHIQIHMQTQMHIQIHMQIQMHIQIHMHIQMHIQIHMQIKKIFRKIRKKFRRKIPPKNRIHGAKHFFQLILELVLIGIVHQNVEDRVKTQRRVFSRVPGCLDRPPPPTFSQQNSRMPFFQIKMEISKLHV